MADEHLRQLERRAANGDVRAEARLLVGRVRAGMHRDDGVEVLAAIGNPVACDALGVPVITVKSIDQLHEALKPYKKVFMARAALAAARSVEPIIREIRNESVHFQALDAIQAWTECKPEQSKEVKLSLVEINRQFRYSGRPLSAMEGNSFDAAGRAAWYATMTVTDTIRKKADDKAHRAILHARESLRGTGGVSARQAEQRVIEAIRADMYAWLAG